MSLQSRPPKLISVNKRMMEITPEELENATPNIEIHLGMFFISFLKETDLII